MNLIKLSATASTNSFLKELCKTETLDNFTVVVSDHQTKGRGQINAVWQSEGGKNLTFSVFVRFEGLKIEDQFYLSKIVSVALVAVLSSKISSKISLKWPNDILAEGYKIAGILIENSVRKTNLVEAVIGVGLNVNQTYFDNLPKASSLKLLTNETFDLDVLLKEIIDSLKSHLELLNQNKFEIINRLYFESLHNFNKPAMYKDTFGNVFMGKIVGVSNTGRLQIELENEIIQEFDLKEIVFLSVQ